MTADEYVVERLQHMEDANDYLERQVEAMQETINLLREDLEFMKSLWTHFGAGEGTSEHFSASYIWEKWNGETFNRLKEIICDED